MTEEFIGSIIDHIAQAKSEAYKRGIKANAVVISDKLYFSRLLGYGVDVPMVCGLKCIYSEDLPDDTSFAVCKAHSLPVTKDERIRELEEENQRLNEAIERVKEFANKLINPDDDFLALLFGGTD
jgi:hypothetical protein